MLSALILLVFILNGIATLLLWYAIVTAVNSKSDRQSHFPILTRNTFAVIARYRQIYPTGNLHIAFGATLFVGILAVFGLIASQ